MLGRLGFAGRLMAIVLMALIVLAASIAVLGYLVNARSDQGDGWAALPQRAAAVVELLDHADSRQRELIMQAINSESVSAKLITDRPSQAADHRRLATVEWIVAQFLREVGRREVIATLDSDRRWTLRDIKVGQLRMFAREPLHVAIALADGHWIEFETRVEISPGVLGFPPGFLIGIIGATVGMLAILAIAREARPLRELSSAVSLFAKDATPRPVAARGAPEIAALIASINDMQSRIAALMKGRTILLGAISHDLKTFITRLRLRVENMPEGEAQDKAIRDLDDMTALIDDALAIARGGTVSERRELLDLGTLLSAEIADRTPGHVRLLPAPTNLDARVSGDPVAVRRLFCNLIDNAASHGNDIAVRIEPREQEIIVLVDDNGPGIPQEERIAVFEPFYRLDLSRSRVTGGSGLGLAIAKQIVDAHGGSVHAERSPLGGARLVVSMPRYRA